MANTVHSVEKALKVLEVLSSDSQGLRIAEIVRGVEMPYTTVYRLVETLVVSGYVQLDAETGRYTLSYKTLSLCRGLDQQNMLKKVAAFHLASLVERFGETVNLAVLEGREVIYLDTVVSPRSISLYIPIGTRMLAHQTALGKVLLAFTLQPLLAHFHGIEPSSLERATHNTITSLSELKEHLEKVRRQRYAVDDEEAELGFRCIAARIVNFEGKSVAAISLSAPKVRLSDAQVPEVAQGVIQTAESISKELGFSYQELAVL